MKRALGLLLLMATVTLGKAETLVPLRIAQTFRATAPSTAAGSCVFGTSPNVLANDTGVNYRCDVTNAYVAMSSGAVGSGTPDYLTKWDILGTGLTDSLAHDDSVDFTVTTPSSGGNTGATISLTGAGLVDGGAVLIRSGDGTDPGSDAGTLTIQTGDADVEGGNLTIRTGDCTNHGIGGSFQTQLGSGGLDGLAGNAGGSGSYVAGNARSGNNNGGSWSWTAGQKNGSGINGKIQFQTGGTGFFGDLNFDALSANRTYAFPNQAGTVALTSDIAAVISDTAYNAGTWDSVTTIAPSKNAVRDKFETRTGSGNLVYDNTPTLITPVLGAATATTINKVTVTQPTTGSTLTIDDGFTLHATGDVTALSGSHTGASSGTNTGDQTITLTGPVTGSGTGSFVTTITDKAVTLAKMDDVATSSVFYRKTAGTGVPEVNTLATLKTDLGLTGTNSGDQTITLTGDVTGSGTGSFATTIATGAVTSGKILDGTIAAADLGTGSVDVSSSVVTGTLAAGREPAHTGEVTNSAGSLALMIDKTIAPTWTGLHTFQATISDLSTTATQLTHGYDSTNKVSWDTTSAGATTATLAANTTNTDRLTLTPSGASMAAGTATFKVTDLSGNQRFYVGRTAGAGATNHGVRMGFDASNYLQIVTVSAGATTMSLTGSTSLALPSTTTATTPNWTTPTLTGTITATTGVINSSAGAASDAFAFNTTATRNTSSKALTFNDNGTEVYTIIKTSSGYAQQSNYDLKLTSAGAGFYVKEGTNATMGTATANGTTAVTVSTTKVTASSRIFLTCNDPNGGTPGIEYVSTRTAGTSFAIKSSAGDTCIVAWIIVEPS